jgi:hypothetical protein
MTDEKKGQLISACSRLEKALREAGATGVGLKELIDSCSYFDEGDRKHLKKINHARNKIMHENANYYSDSDIDHFVNYIDGVVSSLKSEIERDTVSYYSESSPSPYIYCPSVVVSPVEAKEESIYNYPIVQGVQLPKNAPPFRNPNGFGNCIGLSLTSSLISLVVFGISFCVFHAFIDSNFLCCFFAAIVSVIAYFVAWSIVFFDDTDGKFYSDNCSDFWSCFIGGTVVYFVTLTIGILLVILFFKGIWNLITG